MAVDHFSGTNGSGPERVIRAIIAPRLLKTLARHDAPYDEDAGDDR